MKSIGEVYILQNKSTGGINSVYQTYREADRYRKRLGKPENYQIILRTVQQFETQET